MAIDLSSGGFAKQLSRARSFAFQSDLEALRSRGLARGASLDNSIVVGERGVLNPGGLRYADELVRHKALDAIGDLHLLGHSLIGEYRAHNSGHKLNCEAVRALLAQPDAFEIVSYDDPATVPVAYHQGPAAIAA